MSKGIIIKKFTFEAGHKIPDHRKCGVMHGHSWGLKISIKGDVLNNGMVMDFHDLKKIVVDNVIGDGDTNRLLDHNDLNAFFPDFIPTCENIAKWIWNKLQPVLSQHGVELQRVKLSETTDNFFAYYGE